MKTFAKAGRDGGVGFLGVDGFFDAFAAFFAKFDTRFVASFENLDAIIGIRVVASRDIDGEIETHFIKTVINGWGRENTCVGVFDAKSLEGDFEILENPFGRFACIASNKYFDIVVSVID